MTVRRSIENLTARLALYEAHSQRVDACFVHTHAGHRTEVTRLLPERGGKLTMSRKRSAFATASRCSQMASRCQFHSSGVVGSIICQAWRTNSANESRASDWSSRARLNLSAFLRSKTVSSSASRFGFACLIAFYPQETKVN